MEELFYEMIFKRKSFHIFKDIDKISPSELKSIKENFNTFKPLINDIKIDMKIVPAKETTCNRGEEYCILLYSEKKDNYLQNIGYIGEQLDLYLPSLNIGALWFGIGKVENTKYNNLDFVIMIGISKIREDKFRKDIFKSKRKPLSEIWNSTFYEDIGKIVRFAPSACNTQPWKVEVTESELKIYRYKKPGKRGIMPIDRVVYYNKIDIGIFLLFLEICFKHNKIIFNRELFIDQADNDTEKTLIAKYNIT